MRPKSAFTGLKLGICGPKDCSPSDYKALTNEILELAVPYMGPITNGAAKSVNDITTTIYFPDVE